jgi:hypothetical protein
MTERELPVDCQQRLNRLAVGYLLTGSMTGNYWGIPLVVAVQALSGYTDFLLNPCPAFLSGR